jgi:hypothetical protein
MQTRPSGFLSFSDPLDFSNQPEAAPMTKIREDCKTLSPNSPEKICAWTVNGLIDAKLARKLLLFSPMNIDTR